MDDEYTPKYLNSDTHSIGACQRGHAQIRAECSL